MKKFWSGVAIAVVAGVILSFWSSYYAKNFDTHPTEQDSSIKQALYAYGAFINKFTGKNQQIAASNADSDKVDPPMMHQQTQDTHPNKQQQRRYQADDFAISEFKVVKSEGKAILNFSIWNKSDKTLYINNNSARGFSVSSDGGMSSNYYVQNMSSSYRPSEKPEDYTPISQGATLYVSVSFPSDSVKGKIGNFNFNLVQLKAGKPIEHTFSEQVPLPE